MLKNKNQYNKLFILGIFLLVIGTVALTYNYFKEKKLQAFDKMNIALIETEIPDNIDNDDDIPEVDGQPLEEPSNNDEENNNDEQPSIQTPKPKPIDYTKYYVGTLEIPKINLKKGFLEIDSPYNNVDRNVTVIQTSKYPDVEKGNFILAAHTGSSSVSFFTKLHDLVLGDLAYINYKEKNYTYKLVDIYTEPKDGSIAIYRDTEKTTLTLITCTKNTRDKQTVFILELINVE